MGAAKKIASALAVRIACRGADALPLDKLVSFQGKLKTLAEKDALMLQRQIERHGFSFPVAVWRAPDGKNNILDGHQRVEVVRRMVADGWQCPPLPVVWVDAKDKIEAKRKLLAAAAQFGIVSLEGLEEFALDDDLDVGDLLLDLSFPGLGLNLNEKVANELPEIEEDEPPELPKNPVTKLGDVWQLGEHRLVCGDSTAVKFCPPVDLVFTSPPYAQQRLYGQEKPIEWDALMRGVFANLPTHDETQVLVNLGLTHSDGEWQPYWESWIAWMREQGWRRFGWYVWDQGAGLPGDWNGRFAPSHEWIFHFNRQARKPAKTERLKYAGKETGGGLRKPDGTLSPSNHAGRAIQSHKIADSVWRITRHKGTTQHPAVFPVALPAFAMNCWSGTVYDPFAGSGTTLIAAEQLERVCYAVELNPAYVDVAVERWQNLTGQKAKRMPNSRS